MASSCCLDPVKSCLRVLSVYLSVGLENHYTFNAESIQGVCVGGLMGTKRQRCTGICMCICAVWCPGVKVLFA